MQTTIDVIQYAQQLKQQSINSIRLLEVDISRNFDELIYILQTMDEQLKSSSPENTSKEEG